MLKSKYSQKGRALQGVEPKLSKENESFLSGKFNLL